MTCQEKMERVTEIDRLIGNNMMLSIVGFGEYLKLRKERDFLVQSLKHYRPVGGNA